MKTIASEIRLAEAGDAQALAAIHESAWRSAYSGMIPFRSLSAMLSRRGPEWWTRAIDSKAAILVIEFDGLAIGYATLGHNRTRSLDVGGEIYEIYLRPEYQGLGFGKRLFEAARRLLEEHGLQGMAVWALAENDAAVNFYFDSGGHDVAEGDETFDGVTLRKIAFVWH